MDIEQVVADVEDTIPGYPFIYKAEEIAKLADCSVEEAKEALRKYQHSVEV